MKIAIKENYTYIESKWLDWVGDGTILTTSPYDCQITTIDDAYADAVYEDFDLIDDVYTFNPSKYDARKNADILAQREGERKELYAEYDGLESKYQARITCGVDVEESTRKLRLIVDYKVSVGDTVNQPGFPNTVTYPEKPNLE